MEKGSGFWNLPVAVPGADRKMKTVGVQRAEATY